MQRLVWLFTPDPISPIADRVRQANAGMKQLAQELGFEHRDSQMWCRDLWCCWLNEPGEGEQLVLSAEKGGQLAHPEKEALRDAGRA